MKRVAITILKVLIGIAVGYLLIRLVTLLAVGITILALYMLSLFGYRVSVFIVIGIGLALLGATVYYIMKETRRDRI